jgi:hypothetical protein
MSDNKDKGTKIKFKGSKMPSSMLDLAKKGSPKSVKIKVKMK